MQKTQIKDELDTDVMAKEFLMQFPRQAFTVGQFVCQLLLSGFPFI